MEELISEIKKAEDEAAAIISKAVEEARRIEASTEAEIEEIKLRYENKLKDDSNIVRGAAKSSINKLFTEERLAVSQNEQKLKQQTQAKIMPCVDFVYDFIVKEYTK